MKIEKIEKIVMYAKDDNGNSVIFQTPEGVIIANACIEQRLGGDCYFNANIVPTTGKSEIFTGIVQTPNTEPVLENEFNSILEES